MTDGTTPDRPLQPPGRWDKDGAGALDHAEFSRFLRAGLKINKQTVSDSEVMMLIKALDDDNSGTVGIAELADFVQRGTATFFSAGGDDGEAADNGVSRPF